MVIILKTVSKKLPKEKFEIEKLPKGKCCILFYDNIEKNEFKERYEYELYRYETIYRPNLYNIVSSNYDQWLEAAKLKEEELSSINISKPVIEVVDENAIDINSLFEYITLMEERIMDLELEVHNLKNPNQIKLRHRTPEHFELSPYEKIKRIISNGKMSEEKILGIMKKSVDNRYMTEDEFSELYDLLIDKYGGE